MRSWPIAERCNVAMFSALWSIYSISWEPPPLLSRMQASILSTSASWK